MVDPGCGDFSQVQKARRSARPSPFSEPLILFIQQQYPFSEKGFNKNELGRLSTNPKARSTYAILST